MSPVLVRRPRVGPRTSLAPRLLRARNGAKSRLLDHQRAQDGEAPPPPAPFVRRLYAVCTLICVHQYDLSTLFVRWFAYISTISVRNELNLYDVGLKLAQLCIHIPILKNTNPSCRAHEPTHPYPSAWYETRTISVRYLDIRTISVRYPYDIWRTSGVHPAYIKHRRCTLHPPLETPKIKQLARVMHSRD